MGDSRDHDHTHNARTEVEPLAHTPGPWAIMPPSPSRYETIVSETETFDFDGVPARQHVAITVKNDGANTSSIREGRELANARLIAAAPDLLEALRATRVELFACAYQLTAKGIIGHPGDSVDRALAASAAAIAKATGQ